MLLHREIYAIYRLSVGCDINQFPTLHRAVVAAALSAHVSWQVITYSH